MAEGERGLLVVECDNCGDLVTEGTVHQCDVGGPVTVAWEDEDEAPTPNEQCTSCGLAINNDHYICQGHQYCLPECPRCGGDLAPIEESLTP